MEEVVHTTSFFHPNGHVKTCPGWFVKGQCEHGHSYVKLLYCGREWCPICSLNDSVSHNRRKSRWIKKLIKMEKVSYLVFTIPEHLRCNFKTKESLNFLTKELVTGYKSGGNWHQGILSDYRFKRGFCRWHWFGDKSPGKYHPHLNVIANFSWLSHDELELLKLQWGLLIGYGKKADVYIEYRDTPSGIMHVLNYVTRATFLDYNWDTRLCCELVRFRNMRVWGWKNGWEDEPDQFTLKGKEHDLFTIGKIEESICPMCGGHISWRKPESSDEIGHLEYRMHVIFPGVYMLSDP